MLSEPVSLSRSWSRVFVREEFEERRATAADRVHFAMLADGGDCDPKAECHWVVGHEGPLFQAWKYVTSSRPQNLPIGLSRIRDTCDDQSDIHIDFTGQITLNVDRLQSERTEVRNPGLEVVFSDDTIPMEARSVPVPECLEHDDVFA